MDIALNIFMVTITFSLCMIIAYIIGKMAFFSFLGIRENRFKSLDGIRGFLALSVFIHHFIITYYWKKNGVWETPSEDIFRNLGLVGVAVFFMITGFLFISKITQKSKDVNWLQLYQSRIFRIFPLYLFALATISLIVFSKTGFQLNVEIVILIKEYVKWVFFLGGRINDFSDTKIIIAGVDWTLKYEWLFYLSLPFLALILKNLKTFGALSISIGCIVLFLNPIDILYFDTKFIIYFCVGGISSYIIYHQKPTLKIKSKLYSTINLFLILVAIFYPNTLDSYHVIVISSFFLLTLAGNDLFGIFSLRSSMLLGEISYSIYLLHGIVLYLIFTNINLITFAEFGFNNYLLLMPFISIVVVVVSAITFIFIEKPLVDIGRKVSFKQLYKK